MTVHEEDLPFAIADGEPLLARLYRDERATTGHAIVSVHGGAWSRNDRTSAHVLDRGLARAGLSVFALDFRQGPAHTFPTTTQDITAGIRFVRANAQRFAVDPDRIGIIGSSSGGQSILLSTLKQGDPMHEGTPIAGPDGRSVDARDISSEVAYAMALWPVSDPMFRYHHARKTGRDDLLEGHHAYFSSEAQMLEASIPRLLDDGEATRLPPLWIVQPGADTNVPQPMTFDLLRALQAAGAEFEYVFYPDQPHALTRDDTPAAARCIADAVAFITRQLQGSGGRQAGKRGSDQGIYLK